MTLTQILGQTKEQLYDLIYKGATAFPGSNDLMHMGLIGAVPYLSGKYGSEIIGKKVPFFKKHSTEIGYLSAIAAETLWQGLVEPSSKYDNPQDKLSDYKGLFDTAMGAIIADIATGPTKQKIYKNKAEL